MRQKPQPRKYGQIMLQGEGGEVTLYLYGIFHPFWGVASEDVAWFLEQHPDATLLRVRVNSIGGFASEGVAIREVIASHAARKLGAVEGLALSAATLPLLCCENVTATSDSVLMIHDAWGETEGNEADHLQAARRLGALSEGVAAQYAAFTGKDKDDIRDLMRAEHYMSAEGAKELGLVHEVTVPGSVNADSEQARATEKMQKLPAEAMMHLRKYPDWVADRMGWQRIADRDPEQLERTIERVLERRAAQAASYRKSIGDRVARARALG